MHYTYYLSNRLKDTGEQFAIGIWFSTSNTETRQIFETTSHNHFKHCNQVSLFVYRFLLSNRVFDGDLIVLPDPFFYKTKLNIHHLIYTVCTVTVPNLVYLPDSSSWIMVHNHIAPREEKSMMKC